jgi:RNA polymerase sigma-70 factor (ECF subfamily)
MPSVQAETAQSSRSDRERRWRAYLNGIMLGETQALADLYDESAPTLFALALRMMRNGADAEEILLDVYEQVWRSARTFDASRGSAWRWLALLLRSRALDRLRTSAVRRDYDSLTAEERPELSSREPLPDQTTILLEERVIILRALSSLPPDQRQAVELAFFSGLTHVEIAAELRVPLGTVKTRIRAAMDKLRISLTQGGLTTAGPGQ